MQSIIGKQRKRRGANYVLINSNFWYSVLTKLKTISVASFAFCQNSICLLVGLSTDITATNNKDNAISSTAPTTNYGTNAQIWLAKIRKRNFSRSVNYKLHSPSGSGTISRWNCFSIKMEITRRSGRKRWSSPNWRRLTGMKLAQLGISMTERIIGFGWWKIITSTVIDSVAVGFTSNVWKSWDFTS